MPMMSACARLPSPPWPICSISGWFPPLPPWCPAPGSPRWPNTAANTRKQTWAYTLTLNCEWTAYRWGALSTCDPASGLLDGDGYMHQWPPATYEHATPEAVQAEIQAQVQRALAAGMDVTHIDTHMGTVIHPKFASGYVQLAMQHRLPAMIPRRDAARLEQMGIEPATAAAQAEFIQQLEEQGMPMFDAGIGMPLDQPEGQLDIAKKAARRAACRDHAFHPAPRGGYA